MTQEPHKNNIVLIMIAIITVLGTIVVAVVNEIGNYNVEKLRQEAELTRIALISVPTQDGTEPVATASAISAPADIPTKPNASSQNVSVAEQYILGYAEKDLAAKPILETCKEPNCYIKFISSVDDLPDDWYHLTGNVVSATANLPDGCRTKQDLANLQVIYMVANNYTPCP